MKTTPSLPSLVFVAAMLAVGAGIAFVLAGFGDSRSGEGHLSIQTAQQMKKVEPQPARDVTEQPAEPGITPARELETART